MMLWLILSLMTAAAAAYVAAPFLSPIDRNAAGQSSEFGIFRDQLAEIEREAKAGLIEPAAAEQARAEIKRRMLAADKRVAGQTPAQPLTALEHRFVFLSVLGFTVLGSILLYAFNGNPALPSAVPGSGPQVSQQPSASIAPAAAPQAQAGGAPALSDVDTMVAKLADRLKANPNDAKGWAMLGWSYLSTNKFALAVEAYKRAASLEPKSAAIRTGLGDALIQAEGGKVTPDAAAVLDESLAIDPKQPRGRFLKGLAKAQAGDPKAAIEDWISVLKDAAPEDQWAPDLRAQIIGLAKQNGLDVSARLPAVVAAVAAAPAVASAPDIAAPGPSAAEIAAAGNLSEGDRSAMIKGMVERLAQKLDANPRNADGWIQLMRARKVMGDADAAKTALTKAMTIFADTPGEQARLKAAASELGVGL